MNHARISISKTSAAEATMDATRNTLLSEPERQVVLALRHALHREPELSNREWKTQQRLRDTLAQAGMEDATVFHDTGLYVDIDGTAPGSRRSIAIRGDIDALPIQEQRPDLPFRSQVPGVMHACGHDMHASIALGTALALHRLRATFSGRVRVIFQPAEEAEPLGGRSVAELGLLDGFDAAVGFHVRTDLDAGMYGARAGAVSKSSDEFRLTLSGEMAHGARPHAGVDAIAIAAAFINEVQKIISREMPADDAAILTIGTIAGGEATNIICPSVAMTGTIRTTSPERRPLLIDRVRQIAEGVATMHRGRADFSFTSGEPPVVNDALMVERFARMVKQSVGEGRFTDRKSGGGSDDFGFYSACVPSIYFWFGSKEPGNEAGVHTPGFAASDELLAPTTELTIRYCLDLLESER